MHLRSDKSPFPALPPSPFSPTPHFVLNEQLVTKKIIALSKLLAKKWGPYQIAYSLKTNYALLHSSMLAKHRVWAEAVSEYELKLALKHGFALSDIVMNGPYKTDAVLKKTLSNQTLVQIDNFADLQRVLQRVTPTSRVGIRLRVRAPQLKPSRFGFAVSTGEALQAVEILHHHGIVLSSLHVHLGSDIGGVEPYTAAAQAMNQLSTVIFAKFGHRIPYLDFGGGFPAHGLPPYGAKRWHTPSIDGYIQTITAELKTNPLFRQQKPTLVVEPGRYLVDDAGLYLTTIVDTQLRGNTQLLTCDGAVTQLPLVYYRPQIVQALTAQGAPKKKRAIKKTLVYGATCREDDVLFTGQLPSCDVGDTLVFYGVGAYNSSMASEFIFSKPPTYIV